MPVTNPFTITWGALALGGTSGTYQLHGPYQISKTFESLRLSFTVVVVATSHGTLQSASDALEDEFRKRDLDLEINIGGTAWDYEFGDSILNTRAEAHKTGDRDTDHGYSRSYRCEVSGDLPADGTQVGLRDLAVNCDYTASRQKTVTMRGTYTAGPSGTAAEQYLGLFDGEAATILAAIDDGATFELVDESYTHDRNNHVATFTRQYDELLVDQSVGLRNDTQIRDHRVAFTDMSTHPGDSIEGVHRMRRLVGTFECSVDIEQTTDLQAVYQGKVRPYLLATFQQTYSPSVFGVEDARVAYDEAKKRLSVAFTFLYQKAGGSEVIEARISASYRERQHIDYTPVHGKGVYDQYADPGWAVRERISHRVIVSLGAATPIRRIGPSGSSGGFPNTPAWFFSGGSEGVGGGSGSGSLSDGWNITQNESSVTTNWIGDPDLGTQVEVSTLTETVVEQWHQKPNGGGGSGLIFGGV